MTASNMFATTPALTTTWRINGSPSIDIKDIGTAPVLSSKRELFFRQDVPPPSAATNGTAPPPVLSKEPLFGKENKDQEETVRYKDRDKERSNTKDLDGYVGFANLPNQVYRKAVKRGFEFTLMVVDDAITINKSHGQLYVAFSCEGKPRDLFVHMPNGATKNIVHPRALQRTLNTKLENIGDAITINKSHGQSLQVCGLNLQNPCFSHGQLYVAFSCEGKPRDLFIHMPNGVTKNIVYSRALQRTLNTKLENIGESGLGKSTLINSMFLADIYSAEYPGPSLRIKKTVQVETTKVLLKENGVNLTLTVVDTPGFGDAVDNSNCWQPVTDYIENKYAEYLNAESRVNRRSMPDSRVHCCLYFIAPSGHGLKPLDVEFMKRLHDKVNIIPVIAKADTMTPEECVHFKKTIMNEIVQHEIKIYEFPDCDDEEENKIQKPLKDRVPFAVVGSNTIIDANGKKVRGRKYPWGVAEVENMEHCDFIALRNMIIRTHMQDLKDITNNVHYENFRCRKLAGVGVDGKPIRISNQNPLAQMEEEKKAHDAKMKKMEQEMEQVFEMKVREKKQKLKDSEVELQRRHEETKKNLDQQQKSLEDKRKAYEKEKNTWEEINKQSLEDMRRKSLESNSKEHVDGKEKKKEKKKGLF